MGIFSRLFGEKPAPQVESRPEPAPEQQTAPQVNNAAMRISEGVQGGELSQLLTSGYGPCTAGVVVNESVAMQVSTFYACLAKIGGAISTLPFHIYKRNTDGTRQRSDDDLWFLLNEEPNPFMPAATWWTYRVTSRLTHGDAFTRIERASRYSNKIVGFHPHHPLLTEVRRIDGRNVYIFHPMYAHDKKIVLDQDDVLHDPGMCFDGLRSLSPIQFAVRQAIANRYTAGKHIGNMVAEGGLPQVYIKSPGNPDPKQREEYKNSWLASTSRGPYGAPVPLILAGGMEAGTLTMSPADMQLIAAMDMSQNDICAVMGVPPVLIGLSEKASNFGTGVEQHQRGLMTGTLNAHVTVFEQEMNRKIYLRAGKFIEADRDVYMEGDSKSQAEYFRAALGGSNGSGWLTQDEVRRKKNLPPIGGEANKLTTWQQGTQSDQAQTV
jgi:HK97 family phage portal protein